MGTPALGHQTQICVEPGASAHAFDTSSEPYEIVSESLRRTTEHAETNGIRATRSHSKERVREVKDAVGGSLEFGCVSPAVLDLWLPRCMGGVESADSFPLAETLPWFGVLIDRITKTFTYHDCKVGKWTLRGSEGQLITMTLDIVGKSQTEGTAYPALTLSVAANAAPYVFHEGVVTLQGSARPVIDWELTVDNLLMPKMRNSLTAQQILEGDRIATFSCTVPFESDQTDLHDQAVGGAAASLVLTNGALSTTATFAALQCTPGDPVIGSRNDELVIPISGFARKSGATAEVAFTNDSVV